jgi:hypothetical protein
MSETFGAPGGFGTTPVPPLDSPAVTPPPIVTGALAEPAEPLVPWISIWTRPRATLRQILHGDPRRFLFRLAALGGIADGMGLVVGSGLGDTLSPEWCLAIALVGGALGGILFLFVTSGLILVAGRWLGGRGGGAQVMAAVAWSSVPEIWGLLLWLPRAALLGDEVFREAPSRIEGNPPAALFFGFLMLAQALIGLWGFLVALKCIGEAHQFSALRAFGTLLVVALLAGVPLVLLMFAAQVLS